MPPKHPVQRGKAAVFHQDGTMQFVDKKRVTGSLIAHFLGPVSVPKPSGDTVMLVSASPPADAKVNKAVKEIWGVEEKGTVLLMKKTTVPRELRETFAFLHGQEM